MRASRILLPILLLFARSGMAQYDTLTLPFRALTIEDGLSQGMVSSIIQDHAGFMWFATKDGLNRYDGYSFRVFRHDPADSTTVRDNTIEVVYEDRAGLIWVGTNIGLDVFDPATEVFHHFPCGGPAPGPPAGKAGPLSPIGSDQCATKAITQDAAGHLWVSTGQGLYRIDADRRGSNPAGPSARVDLVGVCPGVRMHWMAVDVSGVLLGTWSLNLTDLDVRTFTLDTRDEARIAAMIADPQLLPSSPVVAGQGAEDVAAFAADTDRNLTYCLGAALLGAHDYENIPRLVAGAGSTTAPHPPGWMNVIRPTTDANGMLWATDHRLWRYDPRTRRVTRLIPTSPDLRIEALLVVCLYRDRSGAMWMGTNGYGVLLYNPRGERFHKQRLPSLRAMAPLRDGRVFAYTWGPLYFIIQDQSVTPFPIDRRGEGWDLDSYELCMVQEASGAFWWNPGDALTRYDERDGSMLRIVDPDLPVRFPLHMQGDTLINFGSRKAFGRFNTRTRRFSSIPYPIPAQGGSFEFVQAIVQDAQGIFWLGTMKGLLRLDPATRGWTHYATTPKDPRSLSTDVIFCLLNDPKDSNILWVGTNGGGLDRFDKRTGQFTRFSTANGLPNNVIYGLLADDDGQLWMSTNKGIACFDPVTHAVRSFDASDGLQGDEFNRYAYCKTADGSLYFGGVNGVNYFRPEELRPDTLPVVVHITDIKLTNRSIAFGAEGSPLTAPTHLTRELVIAYRDAGMLTFEFATMEFSEPEKHRYQYKLDGFDRDWIMGGNARSAVYTNLDPGTYTFHVRGDNRDGLWDTKGTTFQLIVLPPWWRTWWAYLVYAIVIIGGVLLYIRMRTVGLKRQKERLERTVEQRTAELNQQKEHAEQLRARAEHSEQIKQQFLANMSHEIRTPMNAIMGMGNELHRNAHLPEQEHVIDAITSSSKSLLVIVNDILDLSKIEAGSMRLEKVPMDPRAVLHNVMEVLRYRAEESGLKMEVDIAPDVPAQVLGDPTRLNQILLNLVGNATKFTERGRVCVSVRVREQLTDAVMLHFSITDTGIGIAPDRLPFVFDEFTQAETEHTRIYGGTGLGLTICKRLVEMQGGTISATSTPGQGSTFTFSIPYALASPINEEIVYGREISRSDDLHDLRILLAEDNKMNVMVAKQELKYAIPGARIDVAVNGQLAVEMVGLNDYDLVLMDVRMPVMDGFAATRAIRALGGDKSRIPIVAMTANVLGQGSECTAAGMDAYVPKPIQSEVLVARLREVLQH